MGDDACYWHLPGGPVPRARQETYGCYWSTALADSGATREVPHKKGRGARYHSFGLSCPTEFTTRKVPARARRGRISGGAHTFAGRSCLRVSVFPCGLEPSLSPFFWRSVSPRACHQYRLGICQDRLDRRQNCPCVRQDRLGKRWTCVGL